MLGPIDLSTRELTSSCVALLDELIFIPQCHAGKTFYHIEVPSRSQFFRIGYAEYVFLSLLDGKTTFAQAVTLAIRALGTNALPEPQARQVYTWAIENRLTRFIDQEGENLAANTTPPLRWPQLLARLNPLFIKLPLFKPDRLLAILLPWFGWLFSPFFTVIGVALMIAAVGVVGVHWDRFSLSAKQILSRDNWLWLGLAWIVLKLLHELAHGLVAKRYRGQVTEFGIIFAFLAPSAYVDVTSSWRFTSKWQRIHVAIAGMYFEMVLAALATFAWVSNNFASVAAFALRRHHHGERFDLLFQRQSADATRWLLHLVRLGRNSQLSSRRTTPPARCRSLALFRKADPRHYGRSVFMAG